MNTTRTYITCHMAVMKFQKILSHQIFQVNVGRILKKSYHKKKKKTLPLATEKIPSSPERILSSAAEETPPLSTETTPPSVADESSPHPPERTPPPIVLTPSPPRSPRVTNSGVTDRHLSPRGNGAKKIEASVIQKFNDIFECMENISNRLKAVESKIAGNNINNDHANNNSNNVNYHEGHEDEFILNPDANRQVEIMPGFKTNYTDCANACNAPRISTRARRIILSVWPIERREKLILRPNKKRPDHEVIQESDVLQIINLCLAMQKIKKLDNTKGNNAALNMKLWIGNILKNDRSSRKGTNELDPNNPDEPFNS